MRPPVRMLATILLLLAASSYGDTTVHLVILFTRVGHQMEKQIAYPSMVACEQAREKILEGGNYYRSFDSLVCKPAEKPKS